MNAQREALKRNGMCTNEFPSYQALDFLDSASLMVEIKFRINHKSIKVQQVSSVLCASRTLHSQNSQAARVQTFPGRIQQEIFLFVGN